MNAGRILLALVALWPAAASERWRLQYFYDPPDGAEFSIADLAFPSARCGMAAGEIETGDRPKPYAVSTHDGGKNWLPVRVPEAAISLFFLNERTGWLVGRQHLWLTQNFGGEWTRLASVRGARRVYFLDERRGWAVGDYKSVYRTADGGLSWSPVGAAAKPGTARSTTAYSVIEFAGPKTGMIAGSSGAARATDPDAPPDWMQPDSVPHEWPGMAVSLLTQDGGATWKPSAAPMLGQVTALSLAPDGKGLLLVERLGRAASPSEVYRVELPFGLSRRVFHRKDRVVTDVLAPARGPSYLAAIEPPGTLARSPVPGKLKVLQSKDLTDWSEMDVDYRAVARRACLAAADPGHIWVATDTGMILALATE